MAAIVFSASRPRQEQIQDSSGREGTSGVAVPLSAFLHVAFVSPVGVTAAGISDGGAGLTDGALCRDAG